MEAFSSFFMNPLDIDTTLELLNKGWHIATGLFVQLYVFITVSFFAFYLTPLGEAVAGRNSHWTPQRKRLLVLFCAAALCSGFLGTRFDVQTGDIVSQENFLKENQGILNLRDLITMVAGFVGGRALGLITGTVSGMVRLLLGNGDDLAKASAIAVIILGLLGAEAKKRFPKSVLYSPWLAMELGILATMIQRMILFVWLAVAQGPEYAWRLTFVILIPKLVTNAVGISMIAFIQQMVRKKHDKEEESIQKEIRRIELEKESAQTKSELAENQKELFKANAEKAQADAQRIAAEKKGYEGEVQKNRAEMLILRAQIEPHFLANTLTNISGLTYTDPRQARNWLSTMVKYFRDTRPLIGKDFISLQDELDHTLRYLSFWKLRFPEDFQCPEGVAATLNASLLAWEIPPFCVHILVENACYHGFSAGKPFELKIDVQQNNDALKILVIDDGHGIAKSKLPDIGQKPVESANGIGTGTALYQLKKLLVMVLPGADFMINSGGEGAGTTATLILPRRKTL